MKPRVFDLDDRAVHSNIHIKINIDDTASLKLLVYSVYVDILEPITYELLDEWDAPSLTDHKPHPAFAASVLADCDVFVS